MTCSHCGLDAAPGEARHLDGAVYCCAGCETAASIIRQSGLGGFYALPDRVTNRVSVSGRSFAEFDHDAFQAAHVTQRADGLNEIALYLEGVHCASCVWLVERMPMAVPGAIQAELDVTRALARLALAPLERLRRTAGDVAETADLSRRVPAGEGPEEVDALAGDLNAMLARLQETADGREAALSSARRFAADAGHELRTPLTSLETNLATGSVDAARRDADRLTALVEQLQALARGEAGPPARAEDVDIGELADRVVLGAAARHPALQVRLEAPAEGPVVRGEAESLRMLLDNLVENAALHGRPAGTVVVTATPLPGGGAEVLVDDDGHGIPRAERERVLERFARGEGASGPGTGLGLSIAAAQAARHGGALRLEDGPLGGLRVRVTLPGLPA